MKLHEYQQRAVDFMTGAPAMRRIVCDMEGRFTVQEAVTLDDYRKEWMTVYNCENKNEAGLTEARQWIDTEGGKR